jgi:cephalosporin hydroxylase
LRYIVDDIAFTIEPLDAGSNGARQPISWFEDAGFSTISCWWTQASWQRRYSYQFNWLGRPIIQLPADVMMVQELIWRTRPTLIIETGVAHGGSAILHASVLRLTHDWHAAATLRPRVIAIDIEIRPHNREAIDAHPLASVITLIEGSSIAPAIINRVAGLVQREDRVMVVLDSNHSRDHVACELNAYAPMVSPGCALVVMDGVMPLLANLPAGTRSWLHDHPGTAVEAFLQTPLGRDFEVDRSFDTRALTHSPGGVLTRRAGSQP